MLATAERIQKIANPFQPLFGETEPDEMQELNIKLFEAWKVWETYGTDRDWLNDFEGIALEVKKKSVSWYEIGLIAYKIKIQKSWRNSYKSFRDFCENSLQKTAACINNWIRAAEVLSTLIARGFDILPLSSSVALALSKVETDVGDVWRDLIDRFPAHQITAITVRDYANDPLRQKPKMKGLKLPESKWERVREAAAQAGISPSRMLDRILDHYLGERENDQPGVTEITGNLGEGSAMEAREGEEERKSPDHQAAPGEPSHPDDYHTGTQGETLTEGHVSQDIESPTDKVMKNGTGLYFKSDQAQKEERASDRLKRLAEEYRNNPVKKNRVDLRRDPHCTECGLETTLIACFNLINLSQVPDFWYCETHIKETDYCPDCGRYGGKCACDF